MNLHLPESDEIGCNGQFALKLRLKLLKLVTGFLLLDLGLFKLHLLLGFGDLFGELYSLLFYFCSWVLGLHFGWFFVDYLVLDLLDDLELFVFFELLT